MAKAGRAQLGSLVELHTWTGTQMLLSESRLAGGMQAQLTCHAASRAIKRTVFL